MPFAGGAATEDNAGPFDEAAVDDEDEYLSRRYPDLWGYGLSRARIRSMGDIPVDGTYV